MAANVKKTKIDFILSPNVQNSRLGDLTKQLARGLELEGVITRVLTSPKDRRPEAFIDDLIKHSPDVTISFNGILPDQEGHFLSDLLRIPHIAILTDAPSTYLELAKSQYTIVSCVDSFFTDFFKKAGAKKALFMPFMAPIIEDAKMPSLPDRSIDILMMPDLIDVEAIEREWKQTLPKEMIAVLEDATKMSLNDSSLGFIQAFLERFNQLSQNEREKLKPYHSIPLLYQFEMYLRGVDQLQLIKSLNGKTIDLLIPKGTKEKWQKLLSNTKGSYRFHERTSLETLGQTLKDSKILLHSSPHIKRGTDGMVYTALQYGTYALSSQNPYLNDQFSEEEGVWFYHFGQQQELQKKIDTLLKDEKATQASIERGQKRVRKEFTWREYAHALLEKLPSLSNDLPYGLQQPAKRP